MLTQSVTLTEYLSVRRDTVYLLFSRLLYVKKFLMTSRSLGEMSEKDDVNTSVFAGAGVGKGKGGQKLEASHQWLAG